MKPVSLPLVIVAISCLSTVARSSEEVATDVLERVTADVKYLSSDELEGRGVETKGIELAAEHILKEYKRLGLKPGMPDGTYRQPFEISLGGGSAVAGTDKCKVVFTIGDDKRTLAMKSEYQPLMKGGTGSCQSELVFVGYGISSEEDKYDDYADIDVNGKLVVMIRREPQNRDGGAFRGRQTSEHSYIDTKLNRARRAGAAGILFVNDAAASENGDELTAPAGFGGNGPGIPFIHMKQSVLNDLLAKSPLKVGDEKTLNSLQEISDHIDETLRPVSQMMNVQADVVADFDVKSVTAYNLIAVVEGEGPTADQTIVVGGHYDHIGYGGVGSRARNRRGEIHNGADDNATGTAAVLEIARRLAAGPKPKHRIAIICFSGEERGLLGSRHYVANPVFPLENTVAMLNYDMIGSLRNNTIEVNGVGTASEFEAIVKKADERSSLETTLVPGPFAGSDHLPFFQRQIPCMFCFTGVTPRYHTPDDDFETLNMDGVVSVIDFTYDLLTQIDGLSEPPTFQEVGRRTRRPRQQMAYLGVIPSLGTDDAVEGIPLEGVRKDSPADKVGLQVGDVILQADGKETQNFSNLVDVITAKKPGDKITFQILRKEKKMSMEAKLTTAP